MPDPMTGPMTGQRDQTENRPAEAPATAGVIPYVAMHGRAAEAADFYIRAFGALDRGRLPLDDAPGQLIHCQLDVNGGGLMMTDCVAPGEPRLAPQGFHLQLVVDDADSGGTGPWPPAAPCRCPCSGCSGATAGGCLPIPSA